jgi:hypothetical protein
VINPKTGDASQEDWIDTFWTDFVNSTIVLVRNFNASEDSGQVEVNTVQTDKVVGLNLRTLDGRLNQTITLDGPACVMFVQQPSQTGAWPSKPAELPKLRYELRRKPEGVVACLDGKEWNCVAGDKLADRIVTPWLQVLRGTP